MTVIFNTLLLFFILLLAVPVALLALEIVAALIFSGRPLVKQISNDSRPDIAILVPAHNEAAVIRCTLESIIKQLRCGDRLLVVADNCTDDTAAIAKSAGAEVIERNEPTRIGKSFALDYGLRHLSRSPPPIVIFIDADCQPDVGAIDNLAITCAANSRPVQALDLMIAPSESLVNYQVAEFAWRVKNQVRPLGLAALGLPCQLMGTGMAFPWETINGVAVASGSIVEDLKLGLDLAKQGKAPLFCPLATVKSFFPRFEKGAKKQRQRWEQGHLRLILTEFLPYMYSAISRKNLSLFVQTLDLAIPPLSLLLLLLVLLAFLAGIEALFTSHTSALFISGACLVTMLALIFMCWLKWARDILLLSAAFSVAFYIFRKIPMYRDVIMRDSSSTWNRADREYRND